jgi:hypothetical protein
MRPASWREETFNAFHDPFAVRQAESNLAFNDPKDLVFSVMNVQARKRRPAHDARTPKFRRFHPQSRI